MDSVSMNAMFDMLITACGVYIIVNFILMKATGTIRGTILLPKDIDPERCKDPQAYLKAVGVWQILFGLCCILTSVSGLLQAYLNIDFGLLYYAAYILFFVFAVLYAKAIKKAVALYW